MGIEIKVGRTYRTRGGDLVKIVNDDGHPHYPFYGENGEAWDRQGRYFSERIKHDLDLIEEDDVSMPEENPGCEEEPISPRLSLAMAAATCATSSNSEERRQHRELHDNRLQTDSARRIAMICKAIMFILLGAASVIFSARAEARDLAYMPNQAGGEIVLTTSATPACAKGYLLAYSRGDDGTVITGCWLLGENYVLIKWTLTGAVKLFRTGDFTPFGIEPTATPKERYL